MSCPYFAACSQIFSGLRMSGLHRSKFRNSVQNCCFHGNVEQKSSRGISTHNSHLIHIPVHIPNLFRLLLMLFWRHTCLILSFLLCVLGLDNIVMENVVSFSFLATETQTDRRSRAVRQKAFLTCLVKRRTVLAVWHFVCWTLKVVWWLSFFLLVVQTKRRQLRIPCYWLMQVCSWSLLAPVCQSGDVSHCGGLMGNG